MWKNIHTKYPQELRDFVKAQYALGVRCTDIAAAVRERWPEFAKFSHNSAGMMVGASRTRAPTQRHFRSDDARPPISLGGPAWSRPGQKES